MPLKPPHPRGRSAIRKSRPAGTRKPANNPAASLTPAAAALVSGGATPAGNSPELSTSRGEQPRKKSGKKTTTPPPPPPDLDAAAHAEWLRVLATPSGQALPISAHGLLKLYCQAVGIAAAAHKAISNTAASAPTMAGTVVQSKGNTIIHPAIELANSQTTQAIDFARRLGITPIAPPAPADRQTAARGFK